MNSIEKITPGTNPPTDMHAIIEVPKDGRVKYEIDKNSGLMRADRILHTPMTYPADYGYFPGTLGDDGDPLDAVVVCDAPLRPGTYIAVRPIGVLAMRDQAGGDEKIICVPTDAVDPFYTATRGLEDLPVILRTKMEYFFKHYKDLEPGKWSEVIGWGDVEKAHQIIMDSIEKYNATK
ncbi:inorganic pyrophosphatase [Bacteroidia bacterium]|nr:inorganic pyrophosphatase [Bacteroidia bacterium]